MIQRLIFRASLLAALAVFARPLAAQPIPYAFSASVQPYAPLEGATVISHAVLNSINQVPVPLGFTFIGDGAPYTQIKVGYGGILITDDFDFLVLGYYTHTGFLLKPATQVRYQTEGMAPNRIFKAEWYQMGFDTLSGTISFQVWLHEGSNAVQIHFGPQTVPNPSSTFYNGVSPLIAVLEGYDASTGIAEAAQVVDGPENQPITLTPLYDPAFPWGTDTVNGRLYTFGQIVTGATQTEALLPVGVFPNPATTHLTLQLDGNDFHGEHLVWLSDLAGRTVLQQIADGRNLDISTLPPGFYLLNMFINGRLANGKFVKQLKKSLTTSSTAATFTKSLRFREWA